MGHFPEKFEDSAHSYLEKYSMKWPTRVKRHSMNGPRVSETRATRSICTVEHRSGLHFGVNRPSLLYSLLTLRKILPPPLFPFLVFFCFITIFRLIRARSSPFAERRRPWDWFFWGAGAMWYHFLVALLALLLS